jgi:hypothetical protein
VPHVGGVSPHHVPHVQLRHLVVGEIGGLVAPPAQLGDERVGIPARPGREADEDVRPAPARQPIVESR